MGLLPFIPSYGFTASGNQSDSIRLLRHATLVIELNGKKILLDPFFADKNSVNPIPTFDVRSTIRNPMVDLPISLSDLKILLAETEAVFVTHTHIDHWDEAAVKLLDKSKPVFCQPEDADGIKKQGFKNVQPISDTRNWNEITIHRVGGQHGTGEIGKKMAPVSGFIFETAKNKVYVAGDTIWCPEVKTAIQKYKPNYIVVNGGAAQFSDGGAITMTISDIFNVATTAPSSKIIAVHMDVINHCYLSKRQLREAVQSKESTKDIFVPEDGGKIKV